MRVIENYEPGVIGKAEQKETVSVVVTVYNIAPWLERAVDSILHQTWENLEVILVDDGSTDGSGSICDRYAKQDARVRVIHQKNGGPAAARNTGIEAATGDFFTFVDGDDWLDKQMYEHMLAAMKAYGAQMAVCRYRQVFEKGVKDGSTGRALVFEGQEILKSFLEEREEILIQNAPWNKLYAHSLIGDLRFPDCLYEDMLYTLRLLNRPARSVYLDRAYYHYVCDRSESVMNRGLTEKIFTDLIPNLYTRASYLRQIGREDLALIQDYFIYKRLLLFYTAVVRSHGPAKKRRLAFLRQKLEAARDDYKAAFSIDCANPKEKKKLELFYLSPFLYTLAMYANDYVLIPLKQRLNGGTRKAPVVGKS